MHKSQLLCGLIAHCRVRRQYSFQAMSIDLNPTKTFLLAFNIVTFILHTQYLAVLFVYRNHAPISASFFRISAFYSAIDVFVIVYEYVCIRLPGMGVWPRMYESIQGQFPITDVIT